MLEKFEQYKTENPELILGGGQGGTGLPLSED